MIKRPVKKNIIPLFASLLSQREFSTNLSEFKKDLQAASEVVVLSGAGISAESGIPTFRGNDGLWRGLDSTILATPAAFRDDPGLVWEYYHYRREMALKAKPNEGHICIAQYETRHRTDKKVTVITQNVDGLHIKAGSNYVIELHGSLFKTRCTRCNDVLVNTKSPICEALKGRGSPTLKKLYSDIPEKDLPHCERLLCNGLLRPHVVWYGEHLEFNLIDILDPILLDCDILLLVGTSSTVLPAAAFPIVMSAGGTIVAEFNIEPPPKRSMFKYYFQGQSAAILPEALSEI